MVVFTENSSQIKKIAYEIAKKVLKTLAVRTDPRALIVSLEGNLGSGKTTFVQGFARGLGIRQKVSSPTFVVLKRYAIPMRRKRGRTPFSPSLYHIDCYRLRNAREFAGLDFTSIMREPGAVALIEWGDRMRRALPKHALHIRFRHAKKNSRRIYIPGPLTEKKYFAL